MIIERKCDNLELGAMLAAQTGLTFGPLTGSSTALCVFLKPYNTGGKIFVYVEAFDTLRTLLSP